MKRATNLSIDAELLDEARALKVNLSKTLEQSLRREIAARRAEAWKRDNADAIDSSNSWVEQNGLPLARHRQF